MSDLMIQEPNLLHEAVHLGIGKDNFDIRREAIYLKKLEENSQKMGKISDFLDIIAKRSEEVRHNPNPPKINFLEIGRAHEADLLDEIREITRQRFNYEPDDSKQGQAGSTIIPDGLYEFDIEHLDKIGKQLNMRVTNVYTAHQTQLQHMHAHAKLESTHIFECMASIVKRCNHSNERITANMLTR